MLKKRFSGLFLFVVFSVLTVQVWAAEPYDDEPIGPPPAPPVLDPEYPPAPPVTHFVPLPGEEEVEEAEERPVSILKRGRPRRFRCRIEVNMSDVWKENLGVVLYLPYPVDNQYQEIQFTGHTPGRVLPVIGHPEDKLLRIYYPPEAFKPGERQAARQECIATVYDVRADLDLITELHPYDRESKIYRRFTSATADVPYIDPLNEDLQEIVSELSEAAEDELDYAHRAFRHAKNVLKRTPKLNTQQEISVTLKKGGEGENINAVFVSLLRAKGIPARMVMARRSNRSPYAWSEFYLEGYGWIPADPSVNVSSDDAFFGAVRMPSGDFRSNRRDMAIVLNHVYGNLKLPAPQDDALPVPASKFLDYVVWGLAVMPRYAISVAELAPPERERGQEGPAKRFNLPLK